MKIKEEYLEEYAKICREQDDIDIELFDEYGVKRGLRDKNGNGVLSGLTNISRIEAFQMVDGVKTPCDGKLLYRGYGCIELVNGFRGKRYGFEEIAYLLLLGRLPDEKELEQFSDVLGSSRTLPRNFTRDVIMKAPSGDIMNSTNKRLTDFIFASDLLKEMREAVTHNQK